MVIFLVVVSVVMTLFISLAIGLAFVLALPFELVVSALSVPVLIYIFIQTVKERH
jgi:hypothetical protein